MIQRQHLNRVASIFDMNNSDKNSIEQRHSRKFTNVSLFRLYFATLTMLRACSLQRPMELEEPRPECIGFDMSGESFAAIVDC